MLNMFYALKFPILNGVFIPFKTYIKSRITIRNNAQVNLTGRLTIGNPDSKAAHISKAPVNIYFGYNSKINLGKSISIGPGVNIIAKNNAILNIGDGTYFTSDMHLEALNSITIGNNCAISWGITIIDHDHHEVIGGSRSNTPKLAEVNIGNHVWIGCNSTILKGTIIGNNCIVGAGSIVKGVFPDNSLIAGNPAKVIKSDIDWK